MAEIQQLPKSSTLSLILSVLAEGNKHGYAILRELRITLWGLFQPDRRIALSGAASDEAG